MHFIVKKFEKIFVPIIVFHVMFKIMYLIYILARNASMQA